VLDHINWEEILKKEDKLIINSDRKHRYHFKSLDSMTEELVYQESVFKYPEYEPEMAVSEDFIETIKDDKLAEALRQLTPKQRKVIELAYWQGYKGYEIAEILGCTSANVSILLDKALKKILESLSE
jgi:RNA polymerase sigma factor (sigma-70 family)